MKIPKHIIMMIEKGNIVSAIKNLATEHSISMDEAKLYIDKYEDSLKAKQQKQQDKIINKQAKTEKRNISYNSSIVTNDKTTNSNNESNSNAIHNNNDTKTPFDTLNEGLSKHLSEQGYKKPFFPYWWNRLASILLGITLLCWLGWWLIN